MQINQSARSTLKQKHCCDHNGHGPILYTKCLTFKSLKAISDTTTFEYTNDTANFSAIVKLVRKVIRNARTRCLSHFPAQIKHEISLSFHSILRQKS